MTTITSLLASLLVGSSSTYQRSAPTYAPYVLDTLYFRQAGLVDRLCIVEARGKIHESRSIGQRRPGSPEALMMDADVSAEEVKIVDGPGKDAVVRLVTYDPPGDVAPGSTGTGGSGIPTVRRPSFVLGRRYLALALGQQDGKLYQPVSLAELRYLKESGFILPNGRDELSLLNAFPTEAYALPKAGDDSARLLYALMDALPAVRGWDRGRLIEFLHQSHGLGYDDSDPHPDDPATLRLRSIGQASTDPLIRLSAYTVLVNWRIVGSEGPFFTALMDAADASALDFELPYDPFFVQPGMPDHPAPGYRIDFDRQRARRLATAAKSEVIRNYLLKHAIG